MRTLERILSDSNAGVDAWSTAVASQLQGALPPNYPVECATAGKVWMLSDGPSAAVRMMLVVGRDRLILASGAGNSSGLRWIPLDSISNLDAIDAPDGSVLHYELSLTGGVELGVECDDELIGSLVSVLSGAADEADGGVSDTDVAADRFDVSNEQTAETAGVARAMPESGAPEPGGPESGDPESGDPEWGDPESGGPGYGDPGSHGTTAGGPASSDAAPSGPESDLKRAAVVAGIPNAGPTLAPTVIPAATPSIRPPAKPVASPVARAGSESHETSAAPANAPIPTLADALFEVDDDPSSLDELPPPSLWEQEVTPPAPIQRVRRSGAAASSPWSPMPPVEPKPGEQDADLPLLPRRSPGVAFNEADLELEALRSAPKAPAAPSEDPTVVAPEPPAERAASEALAPRALVEGADADDASFESNLMASGQEIPAESSGERAEPIGPQGVVPTVFAEQHQWDSPPSGIEAVDLAEAARQPTGITDDWKVWTGDGPTIATPAGFSSVEVDSAVDDFSDLAAAVSSVNDLDSLTPERLANQTPRVAQPIQAGSVGDWWKRVDGWPDSFRSVTYIGGHPDHARRRKNVLLTMDDRGIEAVSAGFGSWSMSVDWADVRSIDVEGSDELMFRSNIRIDLSSCAVVIETVQGTLFFECRLRRPASVRSALAAVTYGLASLQLSGAQP